MEEEKEEKIRDKNLAILVHEERAWLNFYKYFKIKRIGTWP